MSHGCTTVPTDKLST